MLHRLSIKGVAKALASPPVTNAPWRARLAAVNAPTQRPPAWTPTRGLSDAPSAAPAEGKRKPDWPVGTPAPGRAQTLGEAFAAMQHHARGTRKVKASVLNGILERVSSKEQLKYATLGLQIFKKQGIDLSKKTGTLFVKACCRAGSPEAAVEALREAGKYGLDREGVVTARRFNYLLSQLYKAGNSDGFTRAVEEARSRQQALDARSHTLIARFEQEERAKEEEAERAKAEEERLAREAEEKAKREEEEAELKAKEAAEEEARLKEEGENTAKEEEAQAAAAAAEVAADAGAPPAESDAEQDASGNAEAAVPAEAQDADAKQ
eukprot:g8799.t1